MQKHQIPQTDIIIALFVTFCVITLSLPSIPLDMAIKNFLQVVFLFIPGYALLISIFPMNNFSIFKKVIFSFLISIGIIILMVIFENIIFLKILQSYSLIIMATISIILLLLAFIRRKRGSELIKTSNRIVCQKCNGYYELEPGESITDFEACQCGGELKYSDYYPEIREEKEFKTVKKEKSAKKSLYLPYDLILIFIVSLLSLLCSITPNLNESLIMSILAIPFLLFLPGYTIMAFLFPKKDNLEESERIALSFGLSILIAPIIGLILNYSPFGLKIAPWILILSILTLIMAIGTYIKRLSVVEKDRYIFRFKGDISKD